MTQVIDGVTLYRDRSIWRNKTTGEVGQFIGDKFYKLSYTSSLFSDAYELVWNPLPQKGDRATWDEIRSMPQGTLVGSNISAYRVFDGELESLDNLGSYVPAPTETFEILWVP